MMVDWWLMQYWLIDGSRFELKAGEISLAFHRGWRPHVAQDFLSPYTVDTAELSGLRLFASLVLGLGRCESPVLRPHLNTLAMLVSKRIVSSRPLQCMFSACLANCFRPSGWVAVLYQAESYSPYHHHFSDALTITCDEFGVPDHSVLGHPKAEAKLEDVMSCSLAWLMGTSTRNPCVTTRNKGYLEIFPSNISGVCATYHANNWFD